MTVLQQPRVRIALWVAAYLATAGFVLLIQHEPGPAPWYAPVAVGIGLLLRGGLRFAPLILLLETGISAVEYQVAILPALAVAAATVVEQLAGWWLVRRFSLRFERASDALLLAAIAASTAFVGATAGTALCLPFNLAVSPFEQWSVWLVGDATALATLLPLVLLLTDPDRPPGRTDVGPRQALEVTAIFGLAGLMLAGAVAILVSGRMQPGTLRFMWLIPVLWMAIRYQRLLTALLVAAMAASGFWAYSTRELQHAVASLGEGEILVFQLTVAVFSLLGLAVAATVAGQRHALETLDRTRADLQERGEQYARIFAESPTAQLLLDPVTGDLADVNDAAASFYGYPRERMRTMSIYDITTSERDAVLALMRRGLGEAIDFQAVHRLASGERRTVQIHSGGVPVGGRRLLHSVVRDVTAEMAARTELARLAAVVESSADAMITTDLGGTITGWNPAAEGLYSYTRAEVLGRRVEDILGPLELDGEALVALVRGGGSVRFGLAPRRSASGESIPVALTVSPIRDDAGEVVGMSRIGHDLRHVLADQERLRRSEALLADAAAIGGMGSWEIDAATGEAVWSDELYRILGLAPGAPVDQDTLPAMVHPDDRDPVVAAMRDLRDVRTPMAFRVRGPDGAERAVVAAWRPVVEPDGTTRRTVGVLRDVTDERRLEEQLQRAQRLESIGLLAGGIAHDFNNLLTAIAGFTELARMAAAAGDPAGDDLEQVLHAVARARSLTSQLLTFGRRAIVRPEPVDVVAAVESLVPMLRRLLGERISILTELHGPAAVLIDAGQLDQILVNLSVNARDAMPEGGHVRIAVRTVAAASDTGGAETVVRIEVEDDGHGIPPDLLENIFLPFFTTKERGHGTGLGLATVLGIVSQARGRVDVASRVGEGTRFIVDIPAITPGPLEITPPEVVPVAHGSGLVLFVEDEDLVRRVGERVLRQAGFRVVVASNVPDALVIAGRERPDILVTDIVLPGAGDGISLAEALRERWPALPVLMVTGYTERVPPDWATLLTKPYEVAELVASIRALLDEARPVARA